MGRHSWEGDGLQLSQILHFRPGFSCGVPVVVVFALRMPQWFPFVCWGGQPLSVSHFFGSKDDLEMQTCDVFSAELRDTLAHTSAEGTE
jgi:hypothetical protein